MKSARNVANVMGNDMNSMDTMANATNDRRAPPKYQPHARQRALVEPPAPPIELTPLVACSADTAQDVLWHIAEYAPQLRKWLVANPSATPAMLEYLAQVGGPGVPEALRILLKFVGNERFRKRSALHRKHGIVDLLAIERAVGQRMFGDDL